MNRNRRPAFWVVSCRAGRASLARHPGQPLPRSLRMQDHGISVIKPRCHTPRALSRPCPSAANRGGRGETDENRGCPARRARPWRRAAACPDGRGCAGHRPSRTGWPGSGRGAHCEHRHRPAGRCLQPGAAEAGPGGVRDHRQPQRGRGTSSRTAGSGWLPPISTSRCAMWRPGRSWPCRGWRLTCCGPPGSGGNATSARGCPSHWSPHPMPRGYARALADDDRAIEVRPSDNDYIFSNGPGPAG